MSVGADREHSTPCRVAKSSTRADSIERLYTKDGGRGTTQRLAALHEAVRLRSAAFASSRSAGSFESPTAQSAKCSSAERFTESTEPHQPSYSSRRLWHHGSEPERRRPPRDCSEGGTVGFVEPTKFSWAVDARRGSVQEKAATQVEGPIPRPKRSGRRKTFDRKIDAQRFLERPAADIQLGDWIDPRQRREFEDIATQWFATTGSWRHRTPPWLREEPPHFMSGHTSRDGGREHRLARCRDLHQRLLDRGLSPKTVRECVSVLSLVMKTAVRAKVIRENPAASHSIPRRRPRSQPSVGGRVVCTWAGDAR